MIFRDKQLLISKHLFPHNVKTLPNVVENFTWGITKCLAQTKLTKKDFEWVQKNYHHYQEFNYLLPKIVELTQNPLEVFVCITEVMEDSIISHNMLNHKAKWEDVFSSEYIKHNIGIREISGLDGLTKQPIVKGKTNTQSFDSGCKQCEESQFAHFLNILSILEKNDVTAMTNLNLSNSDMDDCDASILAKLIKQGKLPNLKAIDMSDNQITSTGEGYFVNSLESLKTQDIAVILKKITAIGNEAIKEAIDFTLKGLKYAVDQHAKNAGLIEADTIAIYGGKHCEQALSTGVKVISMGLIKECGKHPEIVKILQQGVWQAKVVAGLGLFALTVGNNLDALATPEMMHCIAGWTKGIGDVPVDEYTQPLLGDSYDY